MVEIYVKMYELEFKDVKKLPYNFEILLIDTLYETEKFLTAEEVVKKINHTNYPRRNSFNFFCSKNPEKYL